MLIFTLIPIGIIWWRYFNFLKKNWKIVFITALIGLPYQFIADPAAEAWRAWFFDDKKVVGIWIANFPIENTIFIALVCIAISSAVLVFIRHFEKKKSE